VWEIEGKLAENGARPIIFYNRFAYCCRRTRRDRRRPPLRAVGVIYSPATANLPTLETASIGRSGRHTSAGAAQQVERGPTAGGLNDLVPERFEMINGDLAHILLIIDNKHRRPTAKSPGMFAVP
jgi:hypothetical protein